MDDCVVSFIVGRHPDDAVVIDADEARAVRLLEQAGLVPGVRHARQASGLSPGPGPGHDRAGQDGKGRDGSASRPSVGPVPPWGVPRSSRHPPDPQGGDDRRRDLGPGTDLTWARSPRSGRRGHRPGGGVFDATRDDLLERRRNRGLHGGMQFTYRNPDRSTDPGRLLPGRPVPGGRRLGLPRDADDHGPRPGPGSAARTANGEVARYARQRPLRLAPRGPPDRSPAASATRGWRATVVCDDNALVDRAAAHRAGLGWFGKNSLILLPGLGSWFVLGSVVTDAPLHPVPGR